MSKKYEFTKDVLYYKGHVLHRIKDLQTGELGGWLEKESNLSQEGTCWVADEAKVYGDAKVIGFRSLVCECAEVYENAIIDGGKVSGHAKVYGDAIIGGDEWGPAEIKDFVKVFDHAVAAGNCSVSGHAKIFGHAKFWHCTIEDNANIYDHAKVVRYASVSGDAEICGHACVDGGVRVFDNAIVKDRVVVTDQAMVYGNAQLIDDVIVKGHSEIYGDAVLAENVIMDGNSYARGFEGENYSGNMVVSEDGIKHDDDGSIRQACYEALYYLPTEDNPELFYASDTEEPKL